MRFHRRMKSARLTGFLIALAVTVCSSILAAPAASSSATPLTLGGQGLFSGYARMSRAVPYYSIPNSDPCLLGGGTNVVWDGSLPSLSSGNMPGNFGAGSATFAGTATIGPLESPRTLPFGGYTSATVDSLSTSVSSPAGTASITYGPATSAGAQCIDWDHVDLSAHFGDVFPSDPYLQWTDTTGWWRSIFASLPFEALIEPTTGGAVIERGTMSFSCGQRNNWWGPIGTGGTGIWGSGASEVCSANFYVNAREPADDVPPVVFGMPDRPANGVGWYNADVSVDWQATDDSGSASDPADTVATTEGAGVVYTSGQSCDPANNCATGSITLSIDKTAPTVTCATSRFMVNQPGATVTASVGDALSGPLASTVSTNVGTAQAGTFTVSLTGSDTAGNSRTVVCSYTVGYRFEGFFAPVDNLPTVNKANAGQAIPIKWRITDYNGVGISDPASFVSVTSGSTSCSPTDPLDDVETYSGNSGLQYHGNGNWQFNWKTPKSYAGQCRVMRLNLADGDTSHTAEFRFK